MRILQLAAAAFLAFVAAPAAAQSAGPGLFGYYDPATGQFQPVNPPVASSASADKAGTTRTGTFILKLDIKIKSPLTPADSVPSCNVYLYHTGVVSIYDSASKTANRTGDTAKCTMKIVYRWQGANGVNPVSGYFTVSAGGRYLQHYFQPFKLPANGAETTLALTVWL